MIKRLTNFVETLIFVLIGLMFDIENPLNIVLIILFTVYTILNVINNHKN